MPKRLWDVPASRGILAAACVLAAGGLALFTPGPGGAHDELPAHHISLPENATAAMRQLWQKGGGKIEMDSVTAAEAGAAAATCAGGMASTYECDGIDLMAFMALADIGGTSPSSEANDIWGWTSPASNREYAIIGRVFGTSFIDVTDPGNPVYVGQLPTQGLFGSPWRDIKVYKDHAFIVSEASRHGMQVFNLSLLDDALDTNSTLPVTFASTAHYDRIGNAHNIAINEESGYAYIVGAGGRRGCAGGLHMVDITVPASPSFAGCFDADGYTHDVQCVNYRGPDTDHSGKEICFAANEDTVTIVDVTTKSNPVQISRTGYPGSGYTHQGWLTADHEWLVVDDELDEQDFGHRTRTRFFDVRNLDAPVLDSVYDSASNAIDHNLYMVGGCAVQANYRSGLRILSAVGIGGVFDPTSARLIGYFDIWPEDDLPQFNGAWSSYPYFASGNIVVSGIEQGLYVLRPQTPLSQSCAVDSSTGNTPPVVTITAPTETAFALGETVDFAATSTDQEDQAAPSVAWTTDDGTTELGTGNLISWTPPAGTHEVVATVTDTQGAEGSDSIVITVTDTSGGPTTMDVSAISGATAPANGRRVTAEVTVTILDNQNNPVANATVSGTWSQDANGSGSCVTDSSGRCTVSKSGKSGEAVGFGVDTVTHPTLTYDSALFGASTSVVVGL